MQLLLPSFPLSSLLSFLHLSSPPSFLPSSPLSFLPWLLHLPWVLVMLVLLLMDVVLLE